jgi:1-deoxy-D-xylulose-5-phosphate reductoisomerase
MVGAVGLRPTLAAVAAGKRIALANKEVLVMAGPLVLEAARRSGAEILPVDSEHNAIFQCLEGHKREDLRRVLLCSSGGPFLHRRIGSLKAVTVEEALNHPRWRMGRKISIDSATMMNKGLEMIEASRLFGLSPDQIEVVVHPQAIVHSLVEFADGSLLAQLSRPDMRVPIQYCLSYPERWPSPQEPLDLASASPLEFLEPDLKKFPALTLAREALREGGTMPTVLAAADETAVGAFLNGVIHFTDIMQLVEIVMSLHKPSRAEDIDSILAADLWARQEAKRRLEVLRS